MPFESEAQRRFLWAKHPKIAKRWAHEHKTPKYLPEHVKKEDVKEANIMTFPERVIDALQASAAALQKAEGQLNEKQAAEQHYYGRLPAIIDQCIRYGCIDNTAEDREKMAQWLATPEGALEVIEKLAEREAGQPPAALGQPVDAQGRPAGQIKRAYDSLSSPFVGQKTAAEPESWRRMASGLGLSS